MELPKNWGGITLKQYIEITEIQAVDMDDLDKHAKILSVLSGKDEESILGLSLSDVKKAIRETSFIYSIPKPGKINQKIRIKGNHFMINLNVKEIVGGEYIDLTSMTKEPSEINHNLAQILAIFFKPVNILGLRKKRFYKRNAKGEWIQTLESRAHTAKLIKDHLTMDVVFNMSGFFLRNWQNLIEGIQKSQLESLGKNRKKLKKQAAKMGLPTSGLGT